MGTLNTTKFRCCRAPHTTRFSLCGVQSPVTMRRPNSIRACRIGKGTASAVPQLIAQKSCHPERGRVPRDDKMTIREPEREARSPERSRRGGRPESRDLCIWTLECFSSVSANCSAVPFISDKNFSGSREGADLFGPRFSDRAPSSEPAVCVRKQAFRVGRICARHLRKSLDSADPQSPPHPIFRLRASVVDVLTSPGRHNPFQNGTTLTKTPPTEHNFF
jgi:hypothetical protein